MKHKTEARYPAPSAVVMAMFCDTEFHKRKLEKLGYDYEILAEEDDGETFQLKVQRIVPVEASGIVKKIMPATSTVVNDEHWNRSNNSGGVVVTTKGVPLDMACTVQMRDEGDGCVVEYDWDVKARIPLGAGALEKFVIGDMKKGEARELEAGISFLDDYR